MKKKRTCAATGCDEQVKHEMLMCRPHWRRVPNPIKRAVLKHYRKGQNIHTATPAYMAALHDAVDYVEKEGKE